MTSIVRLEALSGVQDDGPLCYLLQIDEAYILLDCGWDDRFDMGYIDAIKARASQITAILISYGDISHIGALPFLISKCGLRCPVYATVPVFRMGQLFIQDWYLGHKNVHDFSLFDQTDIAAAFERIQHVKYNQMINLKGDTGIQITPLPAGHMVGGAIWRIAKSEADEIVYAVDFNHRNERHLNGCTFDGVGRPHLLITDAFNALQAQPKRKFRDETLVSKLAETMKDGGDVMVVADTAGRVLEIAHFLEQLWSNEPVGLCKFSLVLLSYVASAVAENAKSMIEWMGDRIVLSSQASGSNPFNFQHLKPCQSLTELNEIRSPKTILVSGLDMEYGFSRELFLQCCTDSRNLIIITGRSNDRSLGSKLMRIAESRSRKEAHPDIVTLAVKKRVRLDGQELEAYIRRKREAEQLEARLRLETVRNNARLDNSDTSDDSDDEMETGVVRNRIWPKGETNPSLAFSYDLMTRFVQHQRTSFFKQNRKYFPMFPNIEVKAKWDEYGEIIRPEDYTVIDNTQSGLLNGINEDEADDLAQIPPEEWPTKCIKYVEKIEVLCKVTFLDFDGRTDTDSIRKILSQLKPKQLAIVHGSAKSTRFLAEQSRQNELQQGKVFTPLLGEVIDATVESHIFQVTLSNPLMSSLSFYPVRDAELGWVDARIKRIHAREPTDIFRALEEKSSADLDDQMDSQDFEEPSEELDNHRPIRLEMAAPTSQLSLELLPSNMVPSHEAVFINDPKLSDLKIFLVQNGFQADFTSGVLYVNDVLSISRNGAGRFVVEGPVCEEYYRVRSYLYSQFAIV